MAILDAFGFDDADESFLVITNGGSHGIDTTDPRTGTRCMRLQASGIGAPTVMQYTLPSALATGFIYFALKPSALANGSVIQFLDNTTVHLQLSLRADGKFELFRGAGTTSLAVGTFINSTSGYTQVAIKWTIADAGGVFELRVNGSTSPDINFSGDTRNAATAQVSNVKWNSVAAANGILRVDDVVVQDTTGSAPENDWLGDVGCEYAFPNGTDSNTSWTVTGAASAEAATSEVPADDGTSTIDSNVVGAKILLDFDNLPITTGTIFAALHIHRAIKSSAGAREIRSANKLGATEVSGANHVLSTSWARYKYVYHRDPDGNAWTGANFNSAKWGTELQV